MIVCACMYSMGDEDCVLKTAMLIISGGVTFFSHGGGEEEYQAWGRQALLVGGMSWIVLSMRATRTKRFNST